MEVQKAGLTQRVGVWVPVPFNPLCLGVGGSCCSHPALAVEKSCLQLALDDDLRSLARTTCLGEMNATLQMPGSPCSRAQGSCQPAAALTFVEGGLLRVQWSPSSLGTISMGPVLCGSKLKATLCLSTTLEPARR